MHDNEIVEIGQAVYSLPFLINKCRGGNMIISVSRRTDIPAFYSEWFINRIRDGYCCTANPFNSNQVSYVSLKPCDIDVIVFWTKNPGPLMKYLKELDDMGYKYYFQYTLNGYSRVWEPCTPDVEKSIETFIELSGIIGKEKVIWRYDPIILSNITDYDYHYKNFTGILDSLKGSTERVVISILDDYSASGRRIKKLEKTGVKLMDNPAQNPEFAGLMSSISSYAKDKGIEIYSCAEPIDMSRQGINHGKCIDDAYIKRVFGLNVNSRKDKGQRPECGCVVSKDIGAYDTCLYRCIYCYANR